MTSRPTGRPARKAVPDKATVVVVHRADDLPRENEADTTVVVVAVAAPETVRKVNAESAVTARNEVARHRNRVAMAATVETVVTIGMAAVQTGMVASTVKAARNRTRDVRRRGLVDVRVARPHRQVARKVMQVEAAVRKPVKGRGVLSPQDARKDLEAVRRGPVVVRKDPVVVRKGLEAARRELVVVRKAPEVVRNSVVPIVRTIHSSIPTTIRSMLRDIPTIVVDVATVPVDAAMVAVAAQVVPRREAAPLVTEAFRR